jgi:hypothetical protein
MAHGRSGARPLRGASGHPGRTRETNARRRAKTRARTRPKEV